MHSAVNLLGNQSTLVGIVPSPNCAHSWAFDLAFDGLCSELHMDGTGSNIRKRYIEQIIEAATWAVH